MFRIRMCFDVGYGDRCTLLICDASYDHAAHPQLHECDVHACLGKALLSLAQTREQLGSIVTVQQRSHQFLAKVEHG